MGPRVGVDEVTFSSPLDWSDTVLFVHHERRCRENNLVVYFQYILQTGDVTVK